MENIEGNQNLNSQAQANETNRDLGERDYVRIRIHWMKVVSDLWAWVTTFMMLLIVFWATNLLLSRKWQDTVIMGLLSRFIVWGLILLVILAIPYFLMKYYTWKIKKYYVRNKQLLIKKYNNINVININYDYALKVQQRRFGFSKWLNYGTIEAYDINSKSHVKLDYVENPYAVVDRVGGKFKLVDDIRSTEQDRIHKPSDLFEEVK